MATEIVHETSDASLQGKHGTVPIGTAATRLWHDCKFSRGVVVRAAKTNTVPIFVGVGGPDAVTADTALTGGMPIYPGESLVLPFDSPADVWCVSTQENQFFHWMGV